MNRDSIIQFVAFSTPLGQKDFSDEWFSHTQDQPHAIESTTLLETCGKGSKFDYLSTHEITEGGFQFSFVGKNNVDRFPEHRARIVRLGGYTLTEYPKTQNKAHRQNRVMAFFQDQMPDMDAYRELGGGQVYVYQPYYENSVYSCIIEFNPSKNSIEELQNSLKSKKEAAMVLTLKVCNIALAAAQ